MRALYSRRKNNWFTAVLFSSIVLFLLIAPSCNGTKKFAPLQGSSYQISVPKNFREAKNPIELQEDVNGIFSYVGSWGALFVIVFDHPLIEATSEGLTLFLEEQLYPLLSDKDVIEHKAFTKEDVVGIKYLVASKTDGNYSILMNIDNRKELAQLRLTGKDKKRILDYYSKL